MHFISSVLDFGGASSLDLESFDLDLDLFLELDLDDFLLLSLRPKKRVVRCGEMG